MVIQVETRRTALSRAITAAGAVWSAIFAVAIVALAPVLTSAQWLYLIDMVPGGEYAWGGVSLVAAFLTAHGLVKNKYRLAAIGCATWGSVAALVSGLYILAPWTALNLVTIGWVPWLFPAVIGWAFAAVNWSRKSW